MNPRTVEAMRKRAEDTLMTGFRHRPRNSVEVRALDLAHDVQRLADEVERQQSQIESLVRQITKH